MAGFVNETLNFFKCFSTFMVIFLEVSFPLEN